MCLGMLVAAGGRPVHTRWYIGSVNHVGVSNGVIWNHLLSQPISDAERATSNKGTSGDCGSADSKPPLSILSQKAIVCAGLCVATRFAPRQSTVLLLSQVTQFERHTGRLTIAVSCLLASAGHAW